MCWPFVLPTVDLNTFAYLTGSLLFSLGWEEGTWHGKGGGCFAVIASTLTFLHLVYFSRILMQPIFDISSFILTGSFFATPSLQQKKELAVWSYLPAKKQHLCLLQILRFKEVKWTFIRKKLCHALSRSHDCLSSKYC